MKNQRPIFLNCFSRGGSNIFWNIFLSHPDVVSPIYETLEIFRLDRRGIRREGILAALFSGRLRLFDQWWYKPRRLLNVKTQAYIDQVLYNHKLNTFTNPEMRFKYDGEPYTLEEVQNGRLTTKNNNGLAFLTDAWLAMYPDATIFGLVRDPIPLFESHKRRKIHRTPEAFAHYYNAIAERMLADAARLPNYHLIRFEDVMADPVGMAFKLYALAGLDGEKVKKLRFRAKDHYLPDGTHGNQFPTGGHYWFDLDRVNDILEKDINQIQVKKIPTQEQEEVAALTTRAREQLGYDA